MSISPSQKEKDHQFGQSFEPLPLNDFTTYPETEMLQRAQDFLTLCQKRHTIRDFSNRPVPKSIIETCIQTAGSAPNGANHQPWHFAAISSSEKKRHIRIEAEKEERAFYNGKAGEEWLRALKPIGTDPHKPFLETAPWLIAIFGQRRSIGANGEEFKNYYVPESVSIATGFLIMALHNAGLATLTHTPAPMGFLNEICKRPDNEKPYILLVTGYPSDHAVIPRHATEKKSLQEISSFL